MNYDNVVNTLSDSIAKATEKTLEGASFDKTTTGKVIRDNGEGKYTIACFGGEYTISSFIPLEVNQSVVVIAPQNNFNKLMLLVDDRFLAYLINTVQTQQSQINELKSEIINSEK